MIEEILLWLKGHRHEFKQECALERRAQDDEGNWTVVVMRGAIERCSCGKARETWHWRKSEIVRTFLA